MAQAGVTEKIDKGGALFKFIKPSNLYPRIGAPGKSTTGYDGFLNYVLLVDNWEGPVFESLESDRNFLWFIHRNGKPGMEAML